MVTHLTIAQANSCLISLIWPFPLLPSLLDHAYIVQVLAITRMSEQ